MSQDLVNRKTGELTEMTFSREKVELIKRTIAKGATDDELQLFMHICKRSGLDPFSRQIYAIKRWDSSTQKEVLQAQTSIDGYRLTAERTGEYAPGPKPTFTYDKDGKLLSAVAYIKKWAKGEWHTVDAEAFLDEYVQKKKDGTPTTMWVKMPRVMLAKCAEALAIRRAFPDQTSGLYTVDEMGQATPEDAPPPIAMPKSKAEVAAAIAAQAPLEKKTEPAALGVDERRVLQKKFFAMTDEAGLNDEDKKKFLLAVTKKTSTNDCTREDFDLLFTELKTAMEPPDAAAHP